MFIVIRAVLCRKTYATAKFLQLPRTDIGGHNDNRILEIDGSAIIVSQTAFIQYLEQDVEAIGYKLVVEDDAKTFLASKGYDVQFGARPLKRDIQNHLEDGLSELIVAEE